jgi:hypothetical protein
MEYIVQLSPIQITSLCEITEDETLSTVLENFVCEETLDELVDLTLTHIYRERFRKELQKREGNLEAKQIARVLANNFLDSLTCNIKYMEPNNKLETLMDTVINNIEWLEENKIIYKANRLSPSEILINKRHKERTFGIRSLIKEENTDEMNVFDLALNEEIL